MLLNTDHSACNTLPEDVLRIIFEDLSLETDIVALVCKTWKEVVDSETFREMIRPPRVMGIKQLIDHNPNITFGGKEHPLPRKFYKEYAEKGGLCFFNPGRVKLKIVDGEYKLVVLNSLEAIASLFSNTNLKTCFIDDSWEQALKEIRKEEDPHWVWEESKVIGFNKTYAEQKEMAKEKDKALYPQRYQAVEENSSVRCSELNQRFNISTGLLSIQKAIANLFKYQSTAENSGVVGSEDKPKASKPKQIVIMSNADDHVLGKFMAEAILGERQEVTWDSDSSKFGFVRVKSTMIIRDHEFPLVVDAPIGIGVAPSGLYVSGDYDDAEDDVGFICARKAFSH